MRQQLSAKIKEYLFSVLPITIIVVLLDLTPLIDFTMTPMGKYVGSGLTKSKKILILIFISFLMGFFITVAELKRC